MTIEPDVTPGGSRIEGNSIRCALSPMRICFFITLDEQDETNAKASFLQPFLHLEKVLVIVLVFNTVNGQTTNLVFRP